MLDLFILFLCAFTCEAATILEMNQWKPGILVKPMRCNVTLRPFCVIGYSDPFSPWLPIDSCVLNMTFLDEFVGFVTEVVDVKKSNLQLAKELELEPSLFSCKVLISEREYWIPTRDLMQIQEESDVPQ